MYQKLKFWYICNCKYATEEQRCNFVSDADGIHWPELDEDLCFESFFDKKDQTILYRIFIEHPELNASAIARRLGISQSLFAQYISGAKKPSEARLNQILEQIRAIGRDLSQISAWSPGRWAIRSARGFDITKYYSA